MQVIPGRFGEAVKRQAPAGGRGICMSDWVPCLERRPLGETGVEVRLGNELLDDYLRFVAARCRPNTVPAAGFDLKVSFAFAGKEPAEVSTADVLEFITDQRAPRRGNVLRLDGEAGLSARTIARRLSTSLRAVRLPDRQRRGDSQPGPVGAGHPAPGRPRRAPRQGPADPHAPDAA